MAWKTLKETRRQVEARWTRRNAWMQLQIKKLARLITWFALVGSRSTATGTSKITPSTTEQKWVSRDSPMEDFTHLFFVKSKYSLLWQALVAFRQSASFRAYSSWHVLQTCELVSHVAQSGLHRIHFRRCVSKEKQVDGVPITMGSSYRCSIAQDRIQRISSHRGWETNQLYNWHSCLHSHFDTIRIEDRTEGKVSLLQIRRSLQDRCPHNG